MTQVWGIGVGRREAEKDNAWYILGGCLVDVGVLFLSSFFPHLAPPFPGFDLGTIAISWGLMYLRYRGRSRRNWVCKEKPWGYRSFIQSTYNCYVPTICKPWAYNGAHPCLEDARRGLMHLRHANGHRMTAHRVTLNIIGDTDSMKESGQFLSPVCPL